MPRTESSNDKIALPKPAAGLPCSAVSFSTWRAGKLRTVGTGYVLPRRWAGLKDWDHRDAQALARMLDPLQECAEAAARGKVFFLASGGESSKGTAAFACYQVKGHLADPVFCGNSTAAGAALFAEETGRQASELSVRCESLMAVAQTESVFESDGWRVSQTWRLTPGDAIEEASVAGHRAVSCRLLNDYLLILGPLNVDLQTLVAAAGGMSCLRSRIAILEPSDPIPQVRFLNCNGVHGAAPQTGLATIALVASQVDWVREVIGKGKLRSPAGEEDLPQVSRCQPGGEVSLNLPVVRVALRHLEFADSRGIDGLPETAQTFLKLKAKG